MRFVRQTLTIASKDLKAEIRSKETVNASLSFAIVILLLFNFAFEPTSDVLEDITGGLLWLVFAFAGALVVNRSFARDQPNDCLDALIASPVSASALFLGKAIANYLMLLTLELVCLPIFGLFYNVDWTRQFWPLMLTIGLATWGLSIVGNKFSAMSVNLRLREMMLRMLVYPIMIPCLLGAILLTADFVAGKPLSPNLFLWFRLLVGFDIIYTALAMALADTVLVG
jgi:heme exporter protein B